MAVRRVVHLRRRLKKRVVLKKAKEDAKHVIQKLGVESKDADIKFKDWLIQTKKKSEDDKQFFLKLLLESKEQVPDLLRDKISQLAVNLSLYRELFEADALLDHGLRQYGRATPHAGGLPLTELYKTFASDTLFEPDHQLQEWARGRLDHISEQLRLGIGNTKPFRDCLWGRSFSDRCHFTDQASGFVVHCGTPLETVAATLALCSLRKQGCLPGLKIVVVSAEKNRECHMTRMGMLKCCADA
mmetsp:Transcript_32239/g.74407  ORF Transcript_32239/g.74407 Transcript_32239/m.74407 type:complete len:243 (+) Transcript_32239:40-768(+)